MSSSQHDSEMAKLQKRIKQQQKHNSKNRISAPKLTPAEVRSFGQSLTGANEVGSTAPISVQRTSVIAPLVSPEHANHHQIQGNASVTLPQSSSTPTDRTQDSNTVNGHGHIYAPKPQLSGLAPLLNKGPSRPTSAASYRGISTYRGPEITRTGSITMLRQPPSDIVSNPLSQFSRPRRSTTGSSPERSESRNSVGSGFENNASNLPNQVVVTNPSSIRPPSSNQSIEPSVSTEESRDLLAGSAVSDLEDSGSTVAHEPEDRVDQTAVDDKMLNQVYQPGSKWSWRKSFNHPKIEEKDVAVLKKGRRRSISFFKRDSSTHSIPYSSTQAGTVPEMKESLKADLPSVKGARSAAEDNDPASTILFEPHPGVRPLSPEVQTSSQNRKEQMADQRLVPPDHRGKGKGKENGTPMYGRCSCCGKLRKPNGFHSELTPVIENENLRSNFSLEADRTSTASKTRSSSVSSANRNKYIPIIPMPVGVTQAVQASIEPAYDVMVNGPGDIIATNAGPVSTPSIPVTEPQISRFSSLHISEEQAKKFREEKRLSMNNEKSNQPPITPEMLESYREATSRNTSNQVGVTQSAVQNASSFPELLAHQVNSFAEREEIQDQNEQAILEARNQSLQKLEAGAVENHIGGEESTQRGIDGHKSQNDEFMKKDDQVHNDEINVQTDKKDQRTTRRSLPGMSLFKRRRRSISIPKQPNTLENEYPTEMKAFQYSDENTIPPNRASTVHERVTVTPPGELSAPMIVKSMSAKIETLQPMKMEAATVQLWTNSDKGYNEQLSSTGISNQLEPTKQHNGLSNSMKPSTNDHLVGETSKSTGRNTSSPITARSIADIIVPPQPASTYPSNGVTHNKQMNSNGSRTLQAQDNSRNQSQPYFMNTSSQYSNSAKSVQTSTAAVQNGTEPHIQPYTYNSNISSTNYLPALRLGPNFTGSSSTLHEYVIPNKGAPSSNLYQQVMNATNNPKTPNNQFGTLDYMNNHNHEIQSLAKDQSSENTQTPMVNGAEALKMRQEMRKSRLIDEQRKMRERLGGEALAV